MIIQIIIAVSQLVRLFLGTGIDNAGDEGDKIGSIAASLSLHDVLTIETAWKLETFGLPSLPASLKLSFHLVSTLDKSRFNYSQNKAFY